MADVARFTELLFGDQTLDDLLTSLDKAAATDGPWMLLNEGAEHMRRGEVGRAAEVLLEVAGNPQMETRILLWSWAALRYIGIRPTAHEGDDIKGVVIQVPIENGVDVLAAYADGTARYVNHNGKAIVWEITDATITASIRKLLESCKDLCGILVAALPSKSVKDLVRVTLLTFNGNRVAEACTQSVGSTPINEVLSAGAGLIANLIKRSESMDRVLSNTSSAPSCQKGSKRVRPHY